MAEQLLQRDGFIWEVNRKLDESYTCRRGEDQKDFKKECLPRYYYIKCPLAERLDHKII